LKILKQTEKAKANETSSSSIDRFS